MKVQNQLKRLLVANRGEIAVRIIRAAREYGLETVMVYSDVDECSLATKLADQSIGLKGNSAKETYLNIEKLLAAARQSGADAVHPGYGFLAENAAFAAAVKAAKLTFIGPEPEVIALMGDKDRARKKAVDCGVPIVPGTDAGASPEELRSFCKRVGYPVMAKAVAGGSGRGMRLITQEAELAEKIAEAEAEALGAFGNKTVFVEKFVDRPRHIEVQIFGDSAGNVVHFFERDCTVQRRHQKIIEEAPAPALHANVRAGLLAAAVTLAKSVSYTGAGTVEFLVQGGETANSPFYFLEMNTRIQVEHPVSEIICGVDLVKLQFEIAEGKKIRYAQNEIKTQGHALEFRLYAEDPTNGFRPASGEVLYFSRGGGPGVREDGWAEAGTRISAYYDSLLAKIIVSADSREEAIARARVALSEYVVEGMETTLGFHRWILEQKAFQQSAMDVKWIEREYQGEISPAKNYSPLRLPKTK